MTIRWLPCERKTTLPVALEIALLTQKLNERPDEPGILAALGFAHLQGRDYEQAVTRFERSASRAEHEFRFWDALAFSYLMLGRPEDALETCGRAPVDAAGWRLHYQRGCALRALARHAEAGAEFLAALALDDCDFDPLKALLLPLAKEPDGNPLLEFCDGLAPALRKTPLALAFKALALSRLGRSAEANQIMDLERHVMRMPFEPPAQFGGIEAFNSRLAQEIIASAEPHLSSREGFDVTYVPKVETGSAHETLLIFIRGAIDGYAGKLAELGLETVLPHPPATAELFSGSVILRGQGRNGEHVHPAGYISTVYHVELPASIAACNDHRGDLLLGICDETTGGYRACWGLRHIKPVAGWLTIFPSHFFHDVVPTQTDAPRISVSADLRPIGRKSRRVLTPC